MNSAISALFQEKLIDLYFYNVWEDMLVSYANQDPTDITDEIAWFYCNMTELFLMNNCLLKASYILSEWRRAHYTGISNEYIAILFRMGAIIPINQSVVM